MSMNINVNSSMNNKTYNSAKTTSLKKESSCFTLPHVTEDGVLGGAKINPLPPNIGWTGEQAIAKIESLSAKIVFDFGEDGSVNIKPGLSHEDYHRAKTALREIEMWREGKI